MRPQPSQEWVEREMEEERLRRIVREKDLILSERKSLDIDTVSPRSVTGRDIISHEDIADDDFFARQKTLRSYVSSDRYEDISSPYKRYDRSEQPRRSFYNDTDYYEAARSSYGNMRDEFYAVRHDRGGFPSRQSSSSSEERYVNPREHYEMLKLHRINLMEEIQETSLMLNLCEQQILEEEQEEMYMKEKAKLNRYRSNRMHVHESVRSSRFPGYVDVDYVDRSEDINLRLSSNRKVRFEDESNGTESTCDMDSVSNTSVSSDKKRSLCDDDGDSMDSGKRMKTEDNNSVRPVPDEVIA